MVKCWDIVRGILVEVGGSIGPCFCKLIGGLVLFKANLKLK